MSEELDKMAAKYDLDKTEEYMQNKSDTFYFMSGTLGIFGTVFAINTTIAASTYYDAKSQLEEELHQTTEQTPRIQELERTAQEWGQKTYAGTISTTLMFGIAAIFYLASRKIKRKYELKLVK